MMSVIAVTDAGHPCLRNHDRHDGTTREQLTSMQPGSDVRGSLRVVVGKRTGGSSADQHRRNRWRDTRRLGRLQAPFTFGTAPRNSVIGPGFAEVDLGVAKTWPLAGRGELEFRWEIFNLFNRTNFDVPQRLFGTANFGRIFSAEDPRQMQLGVRLAF